jgi:hypothetical protein
METIKTSLLKDVNFGGSVGVLSKGTRIAIVDIVMAKSHKSGIACSCVLEAKNGRTFFSNIDLMFIVDDNDFVIYLKQHFERNVMKVKTILKTKLTAKRYGL